MLEMRRIWFWQAGAYMHAEWTLNSSAASRDWRSWLPAFLDVVRPRAVRSS